MPLFILLNKSVLHPSVIVLPALVFIFLYFRLNKLFIFKELIQWPKDSYTIRKYILPVIPIAIFLLASTYIFVPTQLFNLPKANTKIWLFLIVFYPLFSAYGQEIIFRSFQYYRYKDIYVNQFGFMSLV